MNKLRSQLAPLLRGRVCLVGLGNPDYGDDGFGPCLAEELERRGVPHVVIAGNAAEKWIGQISEARFDHVLFLDAVDFGGAPGSVVLMNAADVVARFPQVSTHKISLGMLAGVIESNGVSRVWLLGAQPENFLYGSRMSPTLQKTYQAVTELLRELLPAQAPVPAANGVSA